MKVERGVMVMNAQGKAWGVTYEDGYSTSYGWMDAESAPIHNPKYTTKPEDVTYRGSYYVQRLRKEGRVVHVVRETLVKVLRG